MEIKLTPAESEEIFHTALCDAVDYIYSYGIELDYDSEDYKIAREQLKKDSNDSICREDVWLRILKMGSKLTLIDVENDGEYTRSIDIADVHERVQKAPTDSIMCMVEGTGDASTADVILQTVFFEEVIFG